MNAFVFLKLIHQRDIITCSPPACSFLTFSAQQLQLCVLPLSISQLRSFLLNTQSIFLTKKHNPARFIRVFNMPSHKKSTESTSAGGTRPTKESQTRKSRISSPIRFILVVLSSLALSSGLFLLTSGIHLDELRIVSKPLDSPWEIGSLLAWRAVEVGLAWLLGYDGIFPAS